MLVIILRAALFFILVSFVFFLRAIFGDVSFVNFWGRDVIDTMIVYAVILFIYLICMRKLLPRVWCFVLSVGVGICFECLQYVHMFAGTFDVYDIVAYILGGILVVGIDTLTIRALSKYLQSV